MKHKPIQTAFAKQYSNESQVIDKRFAETIFKYIPMNIFS